MADQVEQAMQEMVPALDDMARKKIFNEAELRHIVKRRRAFEYLLQKPAASPRDYLSYVRYEVALESLRMRRSKALHFKKKTISDFAGMKLMHSIFFRSTRRFKGDMRLWCQYIDFCLRSGSTKVLSRVLMRCLKLHPREVDLWILAADRSLKSGELRAARALLLRALRFSKQSPKLWGEFLRLEAQAARNVELGSESDVLGAATTEGTELAKPTEAAWNASLVLLRRACQRLEDNPAACAEFLERASRILEAVRTELTAALGKPPAGLQRTEKALRESIDLMRQRVPAEAPAEAVATVWQLWWEQERRAGASWHAVVEGVAKAASEPALGRLAEVLGAVGAAADADADGRAQALAVLAASPCCSASSGAALRVLEALDGCAERARGTANERTIEAAAAELLRRAAASQPHCLRLRLLLSRHPGATDNDAALSTRSAAELMRAASGGAKADGLDPGAAAQLLLLEAGAEAPREAQLVDALRTLAPGASPRALMAAFLATSVACQAALPVACERAWAAVASRLWDLPRLRADTLQALLEAELRLPAAEAPKAGQLRAQFEELLSHTDDSAERKVVVWLMYVDFVQRRAKGDDSAKLPTAMDLHWRALKSVGDNSFYVERVHSLLGAAAASVSSDRP